MFERAILFIVQKVVARFLVRVRGRVTSEQVSNPVKPEKLNPKARTLKSRKPEEVYVYVALRDASKIVYRMRTTHTRWWPALLPASKSFGDDPGPCGCSRADLWFVTCLLAKIRSQDRMMSSGYKHL